MHINYWKEVKENDFGKIGLVIIVIMVFLAIMAPLFTRYAPTAYSGLLLSPPSLQHPLGTNDVGQDIWARLLYGARTSLLVSSGAALLSTLISILIGSTAALFGGIYDRLVMRVVDAFIVIPPVIVVILTAAYLKPNIFLLILLLACFLWPGGARIIRSQTLSLKEKMPVTAARTFGAGWLHLLFRHIVPDLGPVIMATLIHDARRAVFMETGLSFLGISDAGIISWGKMIQHALQFTYLDAWKWWLLPPGFSLSLLIMAVTFVGHSLERALDPRLRKGESYVRS